MLATSAHSIQLGTLLFHKGVLSVLMMYFVFLFKFLHSQIFPFISMITAQTFTVCMRPLMSFISSIQTAFPIISKLIRKTMMKNIHIKKRSMTLATFRHSPFRLCVAFCSWKKLAMYSIFLKRLCWWHKHWPSTSISLFFADSFPLAPLSNTLSPVAPATSPWSMSTQVPSVQPVWHSFPCRSDNVGLTSSFNFSFIFCEQPSLAEMPRTLRVKSSPPAWPIIVQLFPFWAVLSVCTDRQPSPMS